MEKRMWINSGIIEELDVRQTRLLDLVLEQIRHYYRDLHQTRPCYQYPLTLSRLMRLCRRSGYSVTLALRYLANTVPVGSSKLPPIYYDRITSQKHHAHRPYRIYLRQQV